MKLFTKANIGKVAAEFIGTLLLALMFLIITQTTGVSYFVATSIALTMAVIYMVFGQVSGAHVNPAVTFGMWTARQISTVRGLVYIIAQVLGGFAAWGLFTYLVNQTLPKVSSNFDWRVFVAEAVGAAIFTMAYAAVVLRKNDVLSSALTIGAAFFVGIMVAAIAARGFLNPAVALGASRFSFSVVYVVGPLVGGLVGINLFNELYGTGKGWLSTLKKKK